MSAIRNRLRDGETVQLDGYDVWMIPGLIEPGDKYFAERNSGPHLLTCKKVDPREWIDAVEDAYSFDTGECVRVDMVRSFATSSSARPAND